MRLRAQALTFDDVLLLPGESHILPKDADLKTALTPHIALNIPLLASAMDTVTESRLAIAIALQGGMGILHKNMSIAQQAAEVRAVKAFPAAGMGASACCDTLGRLRVGVAIGVSVESEERVASLIEAGADVIVVDTAHGHSTGVIQRVAWMKKAYPAVALMAGNIATADAAKALADVGADMVKVGIGPGSICTTRIVTGVGVPQLTAISDVRQALQGTSVGIIADGGIRYSGDICKAIAAGASAVMIGSLFAGTDEAPGETDFYHGRSYKAYRGMGSLGAMSARHGSSDRYFQDGVSAMDKLVPEGVEGRVPCKGSIDGVIAQLMGGLRSGMGYTGCADIATMRARPEFIQVTHSGVREGHVHDVQITKEAPNYQVEGDYLK